MWVEITVTDMCTETPWMNSSKLKHCNLFHAQQEIVFITLNCPLQSLVESGSHSLGKHCWTFRMKAKL